MKSVITTIIMFIGLYILIATGVFDLLSQDFVLPIIVGFIVALFIVAIVILGVPNLNKKGVKNDKDKHLD